MSPRTRVAFHLACPAAIGGLFLRQTLAHAADPAPQPTATILLIAGPEDPVAARVAAEIRTLGMVVTTVLDPPATRTDLDVPLQSRSVNAVGAVDIDPGAGEVRIWTVDRSTGQIVLRSVVRLDDDAAVVALRVVEGLRASLNDPDWLTRTIAPPAMPRDTDRAGAPTAAHSRFGASLGAAFASGGAGRFGGSWEGLASGYWLWAPRWGVEVMAAAPLTSARRVDTAGSATLAFGLVAGGVRARVLAARWCVLDASAGVGAAGVRTEGFPNAGFSGTHATTWVLAPYTRVEYAVAIAPPLWLLTNVAGALAIPRPSFTFAGDATTWGTPLLLASIGIEVVFR